MGNKLRPPHKSITTRLLATVAGLVTVAACSGANNSFLTIEERPKLRTTTTTTPEFDDHGWGHPEAQRNLDAVTTNALGNRALVRVRAGVCIEYKTENATVVVQHPIDVIGRPASNVEAQVLGGVVPSMNRDVDGMRKHSDIAIREVDGRLEYGKLGHIPGEVPREVITTLERSDLQMSRSDEEYLGASEYPLGGVVSLAPTVPNSDIPPGNVVYIRAQPERINDYCLIE